MTTEMVKYVKVMNENATVILIGYITSLNNRFQRIQEDIVESTGYLPSFHAVLNSKFELSVLKLLQTLLSHRTAVH